ncbi:MAG: tetratricopeptide repeat protein [Thermodesulfobacteriota bacterium]|nr:tetratricopeptide repeat protein [Thermodesulfobacteriota bacterium]
MKDSFKKGFISFLVLASTYAYAFGEDSGEELYRQGKFKEAMDAFQKADMDHPKEIRFRYNRGCAAFQNGELEASGAAFTSVLKRSDDKEVRFRSLYNRGVIAFKNGDFHSAAEDFQEALKLKPTDEDTRFNFELSLRRKTEEEQKKDQEKDPSQENKERDKKDPKEREPSQEELKRVGPKEENGQENKKIQGEGPKHEEKDLSGELEGKDKDKGADEKPLQSIPLNDSQMARNKAEALLENAKDDPSIVMKMMKNQKKETSRSGKKW